MQTENIATRNSSLYAKRRNAEADKYNDMPKDCVTVEAFMDALRKEIAKRYE